jgi:hypothetical protein
MHGTTPCCTYTFVSMVRSLHQHSVCMLPQRCHNAARSHSHLPPPPAAHPDLIELVSSSATELIQAMAGQMGGGPAPAGTARGGRKASTVSSRFNKQLEDLVVGLEQTGLHFVRCLKPNKTLSANVFEPGMVLGQLRWVERGVCWGAAGCSGEWWYGCVAMWLCGCVAACWAR